MRAVAAAVGNRRIGKLLRPIAPGRAHGLFAGRPRAGQQCAACKGMQHIDRLIADSRDITLGTPDRRARDVSRSVTQDGCAQCCWRLPGRAGW